MWNFGIYVLDLFFVCIYIGRHGGDLDGLGVWCYATYDLRHFNTFMVSSLDRVLRIKFIVTCSFYPAK